MSEDVQTSEESVQASVEFVDHKNLPLPKNIRERAKQGEQLFRPIGLVREIEHS